MFSLVGKQTRLAQWCCGFEEVSFLIEIAMASKACNVIVNC